MGSVSVIGSGIAGLTIAAYLAKDGHEVTILEQADHIGGVTTTISEDGFSWDIGPMLIEGLGANEPAGRVLEELDCRDRIATVRGDRGIVFPDFTVTKPIRYEGALWRRERLRMDFPDEFDQIDKFYRFISSATDLITLDRQCTVSNLPTRIWYRFLTTLSAIELRKYLRMNAGELMDHFFKDPQLKAFFLAILADLTVLPEEYPAIGIPYANLETAYDSRVPAPRAKGFGPRGITYHFIRGGCGRMVQALADVIQEEGGTIKTSTSVSHIDVSAGEVRGVVTAEGERMYADTVICTGSAQGCFHNLLSEDVIQKDFLGSVDALPLMESVFMLHLGVDLDPTPFQSSPVTYYYNIYNFTEAITRARQGMYHGGNEGFVIYVPSMHSPEMAPDGKHAVTVYTVAPNEIEGGWAERKEEMAEGLLEESEVAMPGLSQSASVIKVMTPEDFSNLTHMPEGHSFGGFRPQMGVSGIPHRTPVRGLWFAGSQSESGPGVWSQILASRTLHGKIKRSGR